jgi:hypothetical protein
MPTAEPGPAPGEGETGARPGPTCDGFAPPRAPPSDAPPRLSTGAFVAALTLLLVMFATLNPIWEPADVVAWTENVWMSYAPIPLLVALLLARERKLVRGAFAVECMRLALVKFAISFGVANAIWAVQGPPPVPARAAPPPRPGSGGGLHDVAQPPAAGDLEPLARMDLSGVVLDADGTPVAGALVSAAEGLGDLTFEVPDEPVSLVTDGTGFSPALAVVQAWQPLQLSATDGVLHTAVLAGDEQGFVLNRPVLPTGTTTVMLRRERGVLEVHCSVHVQTERPARLLVLGHPFVSRTDEKGRFVLEGVPERELVLEALAADGRSVRSAVALPPGEARDGLRLRLPPGS